MSFIIYFGTVGALLTALLLFANAMLGPNKPQRPDFGPARVEARLPQPGTTTARLRPVAISSQAQAAPAIQIPRKQPSPTATIGVAPSAHEQQPQMSSNEAEQTSFKQTRARNKTARIRTNRRNSDIASRPHREHSAYSSYAQERPVLPFSVGFW